MIVNILSKRNTSSQHKTERETLLNNTLYYLTGLHEKLNYTGQNFPNLHAPVRETILYETPHTKPNLTEKQNVTLPNSTRHVKKRYETNLFGTKRETRQYRFITTRIIPELLYNYDENLLR